MLKLRQFRHSFENAGDTLEVKIRDAMGNYYYKGRAVIAHKKQMKRLIDDLREKGVTFSSGWFD